MEKFDKKVIMKWGILVVDGYRRGVLYLFLRRWKG